MSPMPTLFLSIIHCALIDQPQMYGPSPCPLHCIITTPRMFCSSLAHTQAPTPLLSKLFHCALWSFSPKVSKYPYPFMSQKVPSSPFLNWESAAHWAQRFLWTSLAGGTSLSPCLPWVSLSVGNVIPSATSRWLLLCPRAETRTPLRIRASHPATSSPLHCSHLKIYWSLSPNSWYLS